MARLPIAARAAAPLALRRAAPAPLLPSRPCIHRAQRARRAASPAPNDCCSDRRSRLAHGNAQQQQQRVVTVCAASWRRRVTWTRSRHITCVCVLVIPAPGVRHLMWPVCAIGCIIRRARRFGLAMHRIQSVNVNVIQSIGLCSSSDVRMLGHTPKRFLYPFVRDCAAVFDHLPRHGTEGCFMHVVHMPFGTQ